MAGNLNIILETLREPRRRQILYWLVERKKANLEELSKFADTRALVHIDLPKLDQMGFIEYEDGIVQYNYSPLLEQFLGLCAELEERSVGHR